MRPLKILFTISLLSTCCFSQKALKPTELETTKLGRLKAEAETMRAQLQAIDAQEQALKVSKQLVQEHGQSKYSEYLGYAETVKQAHARDKDKNWGSADQVSFDPTKGAEGVFTLNPKPKEETKENGEQKDAKEKDEKGQKVKK